ncbi:unnamed protein product [Microthlaspi erraticum]|uniref:DUF7046 domain-containing protein n=1 Tax=Microthlaspi erraticum TaxID=1685480 RepID=A0A6D2HL97_9BRAS|nr:unnamed protein product [Microthlaspi erraticum]
MVSPPPSRSFEDLVVYHLCLPVSRINSGITVHLQESLIEAVLPGSWIRGRRLRSRRFHEYNAAYFQSLAVMRKAKELAASGNVRDLEVFASSEYYESAKPHLRVPLTSKVNELAEKYSGLMTLRSVDCLRQVGWPLLDPEVESHIEKALRSGHVSYKLSIATGFLDIWEEATLSIKREGYSINFNNDLIVAEKFSASTAVTIPFGQPAEFVINCSDGSERSLRADNGSTDLSWLCRERREKKRVFCLANETFRI